MVFFASTRFLFRVRHRLKSRSFFFGGRSGSRYRLKRALILDNDGRNRVTTIMWHGTRPNSGSFLDHRKRLPCPTNKKKNLHLPSPLPITTEIKTMSFRRKRFERQTFDKCCKQRITLSVNTILFDRVTQRHQC